MATLRSLRSILKPVKMLLPGRPGVGKTGALAALVKVGYELFIINCDNNLEILSSLLTDEEADRVHVVDCTDPKVASGDVAKPKSAKAYTKALALLDRWKDGKDGEDFGSPGSWGPERRIVVIDSGTRLGEQAMDYVLAFNGIKITEPRQQDWLTAQRCMTGLWGLLNAAQFNTNVIVIMHIKQIDKPNEKGQMVPVLEYPRGVGTAGSEEVGGWWSTIVQMERRGTGENVKRELLTRPAGLLETKMPALEAERRYDATTGLADIFKLLRGGEHPG